MNFDEIIYVVCLLASVPLAGLSRFLRGANPRQKYFLTVGVLIAVATSGIDACHSLITCIGTYIIIFTSRRPSKVSTGLVFLLNFAYIGLMRLRPQWITGRDKVSGPGNALQLIATLKLTALAFELYDNRDVGKDSSSSSSSSSSSTSKGNMSGSGKSGTMVSTLVPTHDARSGCREPPTLLEYISYVYFFPGLLTGPFCSISDYIAMTNDTLFIVERGQQDQQVTPTVPVQPPSTLWPAVRVVAYSIPYAVLYLLHNKYVPLKWTWTPEYLVLPFLYRACYVWWSSRTFGSRFQFAWTVSDASVVATGLSFSGYTLDSSGGGSGVWSPQWERARNIHPFRLEFATNLPQCIREWNCSVQRWIKRYLFIRLIKLFPQQRRLGTFVASIGSYITVAYWHGFHPGYYLFFLTLPILTTGAVSAMAILRYMESRVFPWLRTGVPAQLVSFAGWFFTYCALMYVSIGFISLKYDQTMHIWGSLYFVGHVLSLLLYLASLLLPKPRAFRVDETDHSEAKKDK